MEKPQSLFAAILVFALISYSCLCHAGAVKVTPAHDHTDFLLSQRHSLPRITVIGGNGTMTRFCGDWLEVIRFDHVKYNNKAV